MTDRELLELAAKAAGLRVDEDFDLLDDRENTGAPKPWRPLTDDGDAFRLAVKLGIAVYPPEKPGDIATCNGPWPESPWVYEDVSGDPYAATRRAIVRAAAALSLMESKE